MLNNSYLKFSWYTTGNGDYEDTYKERIVAPISFESVETEEEIKEYIAQIIAAITMKNNDYIQTINTVRAIEEGKTILYIQDYKEAEELRQLIDKYMTIYIYSFVTNI